MRYKNISELSEYIRGVLPPDAQVIYLEAFNNAWDEYKESRERAINESREEIAHKVAWIAVKRKYVKKGENWKLR